MLFRGAQSISRSTLLYNSLSVRLARRFPVCRLDEPNEFKASTRLALVLSTISPSTQWRQCHIIARWHVMDTKIKGCILNRCQQTGRGGSSRIELYNVWTSRHSAHLLLVSRLPSLCLRIIEKLKQHTGSHFVNMNYVHFWGIEALSLYIFLSDCLPSLDNQELGIL